LNPIYRAFSHVAPLNEETFVSIGAILSDHPPGLLHGMSVSVKGNIPVAGLPWTEGSAIFGERRAEQDAEVVRIARQAGGIVLGTTTLSELGLYGVRNEFEPMGLNPWDAHRTAGGSSTGAGVAAALDLADINIGTDSGGSIRNPACHCGVVGFTPRIGAISLAGTPNRTTSLSSIGLIAKTIEHVARAYAALARRALRTDVTRRLIVPRRLIDNMCDQPTLELFRHACARLHIAGLALIEWEFEHWRVGEQAAGIISLAESGHALAGMDLRRASEGIKRRAEAGQQLDRAVVEHAREDAAALAAEVASALDAVGADAIVTPTWPFAAPLIDAESVEVQRRTVPVDPHRNCFVRAANAIDACAITLPMGLYPAEGVPAGLHLMAPGGDEGQLIELGKLIAPELPTLPPVPPLALPPPEGTQEA
jgi:Asp-tRNA(Asn)/Glu-tRNA(Gln) amidotransferase A subunit family amidase